MKAYLPFRSYLNQANLDYRFDFDRSVYIIYDAQSLIGRRWTQAVIAEISVDIVRYDFERAKEIIDTALTLHHLFKEEQSAQRI